MALSGRAALAMGWRQWTTGVNWRVAIEQSEFTHSGSLVAAGHL